MSLVATCEQSLEGRPCPCSKAAGYKCCYAEWICVKEEVTGCPASPLTAGPVPVFSTTTEQGVATDKLRADWITAIESVNESEMWVGTQCSGLYRLRNEKVEQRYHARQNDLPDNGIGALHTDPQGTLWVVSRSGYLYAHDAGRWTIFGAPGFVKETAGSASKNVVAFAHDRSVWFLHGDKGTLWRMFGGKLTGNGIDAPKDLSTDPPKDRTINAITIDASGVLIAGTSGGPMRLNETELVPFGPSELQDVPVYDVSFAPELGRTYFATELGLWARDVNDSWTELELTAGSTRRPKPETGARVSSVWTASGRLVASFPEDFVVALDRGGKMSQLNVKADVQTIGFLPASGKPARAIVTSSSATPRLERLDEFGWEEYPPLRHTLDEQLEWEVNGLARLQRRKGKPATIAELVTNPKSHAGKFVTLQARSVESRRLTDDKGNTLPFLVHPAFSDFVKSRKNTLRMPELRTSVQEFHISGYFETGGCYQFNAPYFFYITDYAPVAWTPAQTDAVYEQLDSLCTSEETACCCEWNYTPGACPSNPACKN